MKVVVAGDDVGAELAEVIAEHLSEQHDVTVMSEPVGDEPELYAHLTDRVATQVRDGTFDRGILICGTGIGVSVSANKVSGIRAALTHDTYSAERAALSNNAHIITMGSQIVGPALAKTIVDVFLSHSFDETGRSAHKVEAIMEVEAKYKRE